MKTKQTPKTRLIRELDLLWKQRVIEKFGSFCEVCGKPSGPPHHFIPKSLSLALRYCVRNGISLCIGCHFALHFKSDPGIVRTIVAKRGRKWYEWINEHRREFVQKNMKWLNEQKHLLTN
jgi:hypothetical protein